MALKDIIAGFIKSPAPAPTKDMSAVELMRARYAELCEKRDQINAVIQPLKDKLNETNDQIALLNAKALSIADQIQTARGGQIWLDLKTEIGMLARALSGKK